MKENTCHALLCEAGEQQEGKHDSCCRKRGCGALDIELDVIAVTDAHGHVASSFQVVGACSQTPPAQAENLLVARVDVEPGTSTKQQRASQVGSCWCRKTGAACSIAGVKPLRSRQGLQHSPILRADDQQEELQEVHEQPAGRRQRAHVLFVQICSAHLQSTQTGKASEVHKARPAYPSCVVWMQ
jgi:hypothetical protein